MTTQTTKQKADFANEMIRMASDPPICDGSSFFDLGNFGEYHYRFTIPYHILLGYRYHILFRPWAPGHCGQRGLDLSEPAEQLVALAPQ